MLILANPESSRVHYPAALQIVNHTKALGDHDEAAILRKGNYLAISRMSLALQCFIG